jgi:hypothetical protein
VIASAHRHRSAGGLGDRSGTLTLKPPLLKQPLDQFVALPPPLSVRIHQRLLRHAGARGR